MARRALAVAALWSSLVLSACQEPVAPLPAPPTPAPPVAAAAKSSATTAAAGHTTLIKGRVRADLPEARFTVYAAGAPGDTSVLQVRAIEIRYGDAVAPAQRIDGLATDTPWSVSAPGLALLDMNFDGYQDLRLIESRPAGPNLPYLNWLYDPDHQRFVESPALNAITAPRFDASKRELHSDWRDSAARYGTDVYTFRAGQLVPLRRETTSYTGTGVYTVQVSHWIDGAWQIVQTRPGSNP